jgi:hypothetical protein
VDDLERARRAASRAEELLKQNPTDRNARAVAKSMREKLRSMERLVEKKEADRARVFRNQTAIPELSPEQRIEVASTWSALPSEASFSFGFGDLVPDAEEEEEEVGEESDVVSDSDSSESSEDDLEMATRLRTVLPRGPVTAAGLARARVLESAGIKNSAAKRAHDEIAASEEEEEENDDDDDDEQRIVVRNVAGGEQHEYDVDEDDDEEDKQGDDHKPFLSAAKKPRLGASRAFASGQPLFGKGGSIAAAAARHRDDGSDSEDDARDRRPSRGGRVSGARTGAAPAPAPETAASLSKDASGCAFMRTGTATDIESGWRESRDILLQRVRNKERKARNERANGGRRGGGGGGGGGAKGRKF